MPASLYLANKINDLIFSATAWTPPATLYFAAMTVTPTPSGGGTEVVGGSYARVAVTNNSANFPAAAGGQKSTGNTIDFGTASATWGTIVAIAIYDAASGGNLLGYGTLTTPITVSSGQPFSVPAGGGILTES